jgi:hypothetical protein
MQISLPVSRKTVVLKNGRYENGSGANYLLVTMSDLIGFGDFNGDGAEDAAVVVNENFGGSGSFASLVLVLNQSGIPVQSGSAAIGDRQQVNSIHLKEDQITLDLLTHSPKDPMCCPSQPAMWTFTWLGSNLVLIKSSTYTPGGNEQSISVDAPADEEPVNVSVQVSGRISIEMPGTNLIYSIIDSEGKPITEGRVERNTGTLANPLTFTAWVDLSRAASGSRIRLVILVKNTSDDSIVAMDSVELTRK